MVLLPSQGSADNFQLLRQGKADLGFVQGGTSEIQPAGEAILESLGSLFVEPVWLFYKTNSLHKPGGGAASLNALTPLTGLRVNMLPLSRVIAPLSYASELYALRGNIALVRRKLQRRALQPAAD